MRLQLEIKGASPEEKQRGIEAAKAVLAAAGISGEEAADGMAALENWDDSIFDDDEAPTDDEDVAAAIWMDANKAAIMACCADWPSDAVPETYQFLELVD
ncbi:hypothetical protein [Mesorhizobium sp. WSM3626]|uniref:hypothetical protein n=1 Tax=Mesorhizobium sp. WSM3626 TaxID=1040987 RepID=UPI000488A395|nr:hypothetical protein [Mesorhizobium sp. WSM3626]